MTYLYLKLSIIQAYFNIIHSIIEKNKELSINLPEARNNHMKPIT